MPQKTLTTRARTGVLALLLAASWTPPAHAWIDTPFDTTTAAVMQGVLDQAPNRVCSTVDNAQTVYPAAFVFHDNDPGQDHLYQAYDFYNNGPERCVRLQLRWTHQDCGNIRIGHCSSWHWVDPRCIHGFLVCGPTSIRKSSFSEASRRARRPA